MTTATATQTDTISRVVSQVEGIIQAAESAARPLEVDPYRNQLFELFVFSNGAGLTSPNEAGDLTAETLCRELSARCGLLAATQQQAGQPQVKLGPKELQQMRPLWAVMRLWMEWTYAWDRWAEFHPSEAAVED
jgi:hypothetical protein